MRRFTNCNDLEAGDYRYFGNQSCSLALNVGIHFFPIDMGQSEKWEMSIRIKNILFSQMLVVRSLRTYLVFFLSIELFLCDFALRSEICALEFAL